MQSNFWSAARPALLALACASLAGCANTVAVKDVIADPVAHLNTSGTLGPEVAKRLPPGEAPFPFRRMVLEYKATEQRSDRTSGERDLTFTRTVVSDSGGVTRSYDTVRNNGVPFRMNFRTSYRGVFPLKWQTVFVNAANAVMPYEVKSIERLDRFAGRGQGDQVEFTTRFGTQAQIASFSSGREVCTFGALRPASTLSPVFAGQLVALECETYGTNGQLGAKTSYAYLLHYGVALQTAYSDSKTRNTSELVSAKVE